MSGIDTADRVVGPQGITSDVARACLPPAPGGGIHELGGCDG